MELADIEQSAKIAKEASAVLAASDTNARLKALRNIARGLLDRREDILKANALDLQEGAKKVETGAWALAMLERLRLSSEGILKMAKAVEEIAAQPEVVGELVEQYERPNGLKVQRVRVPLGVILMIFESRPNVIVDAAALSIKSGNAIILKGGRDAFHSNAILGEIVREAIAESIPKECVQLVDSNDRQAIEMLLKLDRYIDLVVPRGGEGLIRMVREKSKIPVVAHYRGLCHTYVHEDADISQSVEVCLNAKVHRPAVCNAMESLLVHEQIAPTFLQILIPKLTEAGVEIRACAKTLKSFPQYALVRAQEEDWDREYLDKILSLKIVDGPTEAIVHIRRHGSNHTEAICARDKDVINEFIRGIDASCVCVNTSTRFNDGGELGLGAELGISTSKIHAYGPMGARELTIPRFIVTGEGQIRR